MRRAKELIGKTIIHQTTGDKVAVVHDVVFDAQARKVAALLISTGGWFHDTEVVPWSRVASVGDVVLVHGEGPVITTANAPEIASEISQDARITGTTIMSDTGERLGTVGDLFIDDAGQVVGFEVKQGFLGISGAKFLPAAQVQAVGKDAVIAHASELQADPSAITATAGQPAGKHPSRARQYPADRAASETS